MKRIAIMALLTVGVAGIASAQEFAGGDLLAIHHFDLGSAQSWSGGTDDVTPYDNTVNFGGQAFVNGGADATSITRLVADDLTPDNSVGAAGLAVTSITFSVANTSATGASINARARIRFWNADGAGGGPGTYYSNPAAVGFSFNPFTFAPGVTLLTGTIAAGSMNMPSGTFWAGLTFDNAGGATATQADLNLLGQGLFNPPVVGTSADTAFETTAAGSFFTTPNPPGAQFNFQGTPKANFGWKFTTSNPVPEPASFIAIGAGVLALAASRRRNRK